MSVEVDTIARSALLSTAAGPLPPQERVMFIDGLRGVALAGVLLANLAWWTGDVFMTPSDRAAFSTAPLDEAVRVFLLTFIDNKFIGLFSLLFGLGFAVQLQRGQVSGRPAVPVYVRRLAVLMGIGLVHGFLLWCGDVLRFYALWGLVVVLFSRSSGRALLAWGLLLGVVAPGMWRAVAILSGVADAVPAAELADLQQRTLQAFSSGSYLEMVRWNWAYFWSRAPSETPYYLFILGRFLLGMWVGRRMLWHAPEDHRPLLHWLTWGGLALGLAGNILFAVLSLMRDRDQLPSSDAWMAALQLPMEVGFLGLSAFYACGLALLYQRPAWRRRLDRLAPAGRMALTSYFIHTLLGLWLFYGFAPGPHLMGRVGLSFIFPVWIAVFTLQVWLSRWWLQRYRFGPLEWLWRSLTYGRMQHFRGNGSR